MDAQSSTFEGGFHVRLSMAPLKQRIQVLVVIQQIGVSMLNQAWLH